MTIITITFLIGWKKLWFEFGSFSVCGNTTVAIVPWKYCNRWLQVLNFLNFIQICVSHIYLEGNQAADFLASVAS